jgi:DNA repair exonuclease SbcCD nuclease subunit
MQPLELRLIHAADLHLGYTFGGLPARQRKILQNDEPRLLERLVSLCLERDADALLLAGDVFEHERPGDDTVNALRNALQRLEKAGILVFISPGNHDPYWPDSPWAETRWPDNTVCFGPSRSVFDWKAKRTMVYGAAFTGKFEKVSLWDELVPAPSERQINLLCLHGDVVTEGQVSLYNPIRKSLLSTPHLDYAALGHIHKGLKADPAWPYERAAYAGSWRGRGFDETGPKGVLEVSIRKDSSTVGLPFAHPYRPENRTLNLSFIPMSDYSFLDVSLTRKGDMFTAESILKELRSIAADRGVSFDHVLWRVRLAGDQGERRPAVGQLAASLEAALFYLELTDRSTLRGEKIVLSEHSLRGAFLRESDRAMDDSTLFELAVSLGLEAFEGPLDLERFFAEPQP